MTSATNQSASHCTMASSSAHGFSRRRLIWNTSHVTRIGSNLYTLPPPQSTISTSCSTHKYDSSTRHGGESSSATNSPFFISSQQQSTTQNECDIEMCTKNQPSSRPKKTPSLHHHHQLAIFSVLLLASIVLLLDPLIMAASAQGSINTCLPNCSCPVKKGKHWLSCEGQSLSDLPDPTRIPDERVSSEWEVNSHTTYKT